MGEDNAYGKERISPKEAAAYLGYDDAPRPAWCHVFCEAMDSPGGECCGICGMLSEVTREALDKNFR